jgi:peptidoglycan hydrolase-like protein with peptidoglycan-binding domain
MPLTYSGFSGVSELEACQIRDSAHITPGSKGDHVARIQSALVTLGAGVISSGEIDQGFYGSTTTRCVVSFKTKRNILNFQDAIDPIVGKKTITQLDKEMHDFESRPQPPDAWSLYVSLTPDGDIHDHERCPTRPYASSPGPDGHAQHLGTPIYPRGTKRKINIGGEGEAVGFEDFLVKHPDGSGNYYGPDRPFTETIRMDAASDVCIRSSPLYLYIVKEIVRIAENKCRFTFAGKFDDYLIAKKFGTVIEDRKIEFTNPDPRSLDNYLYTAVVEINKAQANAYLQLKTAVTLPGH